MLTRFLIQLLTADRQFMPPALDTTTSQGTATGAALLPTTIAPLARLMPMGAPQRLYPQDTTIVELAGSAVAGNIESVVELIYYADLPGQAGRYITSDQMRARKKHIHGIRLAITLGTTVGY